jgi:hypothetical protein
MIAQIVNTTRMKEATHDFAQPSTVLLEAFVEIGEPGVLAESTGTTAGSLTGVSVTALVGTLTKVSPSTEEEVFVGGAGLTRPGRELWKAGIVDGAGMAAIVKSRRRGRGAYEYCGI